jgi:hypothetical protein
MNAKIDKTINGKQVTARPIYKGGVQPAYWAATVNQRSLPQQFESATEAFRYAAQSLVS